MRWFCAIVFLSLLLLPAACSQSEQQVLVVTATPDVAAPPTSMPQPTTTTTPTVAATATPLPTPTPHIIPPVDMANLQTYQHPQRIFAVVVPQAWELIREERNTDTVAPAEAADWTYQTTFASPFASAHMDISVRQIEPPEVQPGEVPPESEPPDTLLRPFIEQNFGGQRNLAIGVPEPQPDGSIRLPFAFDAEINHLPTTLIGNSFIQHDHDLITILTITLPEEQAERLQPAVNAMVNSLEIDADAATHNQPAIVRMEPMERYNHPANLFSLDVPAAWEVVDQSSYAVTEIAFTDQYELGTVIVNLADAQGEMGAEEQGAVLVEQLEERYGATIYRFNSVVHAPQLQPDGSVRVAFTYDVMVRGVQTRMLGNAFRWREGAVDVLLITIVPQKQFSFLNEELDTVVTSFQAGAALVNQ
jgi:hypothetical protein